MVQNQWKSLVENQLRETSVSTNWDCVGRFRPLDVPLLFLENEHQESAESRPSPEKVANQRAQNAIRTGVVPRFSGNLYTADSYDGISGFRRPARVCSPPIETQGEPIPILRTLIFRTAGDRSPSV